jgi:hypothetical protein
MTIKPQKPNRTEWEKESVEKLKYLKRKQQDKEATRLLKEFKEHPKEDEDASTD